MSRPNFGHVTVAIHLFILLSVLVVIIRLQRQFRTTNRALKASTVEEREILQRSHTIHLIHRLVAPQAGTLVKIRSVHGFVILQHREKFKTCLDSARTRTVRSKKTVDVQVLIDEKPANSSQLQSNFPLRFS